MSDALPVTIIVVEHDAWHALVIKENIRRAGISNPIIHFDNGAEALAYLGANASDRRDDAALILLDLHMPDIRGADMLNQLRQNSGLKRVPIIALTAAQDKDEAERHAALGCQACIVKPLSYESFSEAVRRIGLRISVMQIPATEA